MFHTQELRVQRPRSRDHPVFFGTMYLHWDGTFESYHYFFSHLRAHISSPIGNTELQVGDAFSIGSDDEKALKKALDICSLIWSVTYVQKQFKPLSNEKKRDGLEA